ADPRFADIAPDWVFAWHNLPGLPLGFAALREGPVNCASRGLRIALAGRTSHASTPERALSPMRALAALMPALADLSRGDVADPDFALVTVTHATLGERAFGVAPGAAELWATLRALTDAGMSALVARAEALARGAATADGLGVSIEHSDVFDHCHNDPEAVAILARALDAQGVPRGEAGLPMRASEDFGRFGARAKTAMFFLGAGERHPGLHEPDYDFPDALAPIAAGAMERVARDLLG
ncbi:MAG: peptidase dimerization domain-containing protein, partial [Hyphomicrobiales bacterium]|nr:peptidase dimerization domain-containing protein [Hyphomicrobiales bacterium]